MLIVFNPSIPNIKTRIHLVYLHTLIIAVGNKPRVIVTCLIDHKPYDKEQVDQLGHYWGF